MCNFFRARLKFRGREIDRCNCGGDESKCDFYPENRKEAEKKMNTAEMWLKAQEDGKTYICNSVLYNKKTGFISATELKPWPINAFDNIDTLMEAQWSLYQEEIIVCMFIGQLGVSTSLLA